MSDSLSGSEQDLPVRRRLEPVCDRFEAAWQAGQRPRLEDYLRDIPDADRTALLGELIALEVVYRRRLGEDPRPEEYRARFPALGPAWRAHVFAGASPAAPDPSPGSEAVRSDKPERAPSVAAPTEPIRPPSLQPSAGSAPGDPSPGRFDFLAPPQAPGELGWLGSYRVLHVLGQGGMGVVFQAEDPHLQRLVALKVMLPALATDAAARRRFLREARAAAALEHDHIVAIYQVGEDRDVPFLAMQLLKGESLLERLKRESRVSPAEVLRIGREIALGLAAAHERGLIHRDIKPGNLWLEPGGRVKVLDFGLARPVTDDLPVTSSGAGVSQAAAANAPLTQAGAIVGTPGYLAPEQVGGHTLDARCDLFSLGCVLYQLCTGQKPFSGADAVSALTAVVTEQPRPPWDFDSAMPLPLSQLVMQLLAKDPAARPPSARAVIEALAAIEHPQPQERRRPQRWAGWATGAAALALLLLLGIVYNSASRDSGRPDSASPQQTGRAGPREEAAPGSQPGGQGNAAAVPGKPRPEVQARINQAIANGVRFLRTVQFLDTPTQPRIGYKALPGLVMLECGVPASEPPVKKIAELVRLHGPALNDTYDLSLAILFLDQLGDPKDHELIQTMALRLVAGQNRLGGWGYHCPVLTSQQHEQLISALKTLRTHSFEEWKKSQAGTANPLPPILEQLPALQEPIALKGPPSNRGGSMITPIPSSR